MFLQTASALVTFIRAAILYPDVLKAAQEEIDRVVGSERLPEHTDKSSLPYVTAVMKETLRQGTCLITLSRG